MNTDTKDKLKHALSVARQSTGSQPIHALADAIECLSTENEYLLKYTTLQNEKIAELESKVTETVGAWKNAEG